MLVWVWLTLALPVAWPRRASAAIVFLRNVATDLFANGFESGDTLRRAS